MYSTVNRTVFVSENFSFDDGEGQVVQARFSVSLAFVVSQVDLDADGKPWNSTPCFKAHDLDAAKSWISTEIADLQKSLVAHV